MRGFFNSLILLMSLGLWLGFSGPAAAAVVVLPTGSSVDGKTIGEYSADCWKWAVGFSQPNDPFTDTTGAKANSNQSGPIFYVAGNNSGSSTRSFTVPADKYLLVALVNGEISQLESPAGTTAAQVRQAAKDQADKIDSLHATLDGVTVPSATLFGHREVSPDFTFHSVPNACCGVPPGDSGVAVADGYYLMLAPLSPGTHVFNFGGTATAFGVSVNVTDTITVVPEPAGLGLLMAAGAALLFRRRGWGL